MSRPITPRDLKDASRVALMLALITAAGSFTYAYADVPPVPPSKGSLQTIALRDLSWVAVTAVVLLIPRLGETGTKCLERLGGTVLGGGAGLVAALSHSAPGATLIAALTGAGGELLGSAGGFSYAGKMVGVSYCVVALPGFGAFGQARDWSVDGAMVKLSVERLVSVFIGVGLVYVLSVLWFPRAASDEAFALAEDAVARLRDLGVCAFRPAAVLAHEVEEEGGGKAAAAPPFPGSYRTEPSAKDRYLVRIATRSLATIEPGVRAAHIAACEAALQAAALARGRLATALGVARKEVLVGRLPVPALGGCRGGHRPATPVSAHEDGAEMAAAAALPTPTTPKQAVAASVASSTSSLTWRPVYLPTVGAASAAWLRRLSPASFTRRALPASQLADVGAAVGAVGRALWVVGDSAGGGFPSYLSTCVKDRYGDSVPCAATTGSSEHAEAAGVVEELSWLVASCLSEALAGLGAARHTWICGRPPSPSPCVAATDDACPDPVRARWAALQNLQAAEKVIGQRRSEFDAAREATLGWVERLHARRMAAGSAAPSDQQPLSPQTSDLPPLPPPRLPNTLEASAVRIRWLALLFGFSECRRGLEELAASVEALRDACEAATGFGANPGLSHTPGVAST